jgi:hypothetical protein
LSDVRLPELVWRPTPNQSGRSGVAVELLAVHETAGPYAGSVAWLCNPKADASAHFVVREDGLEATQLVALSRKAWTQCTFNWRTVSIELANVTAKGYATDYQLRVCARILGWLVMLTGTPPRWSRTGAEPGICRHLDLGAAGCGHTQCGPNLDGWHRLREVGDYELERDGYRDEWARV